MQAQMNEQEATEKAKVIASVIDSILGAHGCSVDVKTLSLSYYDEFNNFQRVTVNLINAPF